MGRWSSKAEPVSVSQGTFDPGRAMDAESEILLPCESKHLPVAVKREKEDSFYGFNN
jgi:hypothetical protein